MQMSGSCKNIFALRLLQILGATAFKASFVCQNARFFGGENNFGIMLFTNFHGRDSALRCPRRRAQRQATEKRALYNVRSVLPDGDAAARRPYHQKSLSKT